MSPSMKIGFETIQSQARHCVLKKGALEDTIDRVQKDTREGEHERNCYCDTSSIRLGSKITG